MVREGEEKRATIRQLEGLTQRQAEASAEMAARLRELEVQGDIGRYREMAARSRELEEHLASSHPNPNPDFNTLSPSKMICTYLCLF